MVRVQKQWKNERHGQANHRQRDGPPTPIDSRSRTTPADHVDRRQIDREHQPSRSPKRDARQTKREELGAGDKGREHRAGQESRPKRKIVQIEAECKPRAGDEQQQEIADRTETGHYPG